MQAILSHEAADGEVAVVEAEALGYAQSNIKTLISVLVQGKDHQRSLDLVFHDAPVKLRLVKGAGPVHLVGAHGVGKICFLLFTLSIYIIHLLLLKLILTSKIITFILDKLT